MRADNSHYLIAAARRRSQATQRRAVAALRRMDREGIAVTFDSVAKEAGVSRAWLYNQPELRTEIERLRQRRRPQQPAVPDRQRASDASLRQRLETAIARTRQLEADNRRLRDALAEALGENRTKPREAGLQALDTSPRRKNSGVIRPC
jgi:hypothetical protein